MNKTYHPLPNANKPGFWRIFGCSSDFQSGRVFTLLLVVGFFVLSRISLFEPGWGSTVFGAELRQQWVEGFETVMPNEMITGAFPITAEEREPFSGIDELFDDDGNDSSEFLLAQRNSISRLDSSIRDTLKAVPNRILSGTIADNSDREADNVNTAYYDWFDSERGRPVPVKIYYPLNASGPCPTILFSHGLGGSNENCAYLGEYWAVNGYVSVFIHHFGSDDTVWKGKVRPLNELRNAYEYNWTGRSRVQDIQFVVRQLERLSGEQRSGPTQLIDMERLGVAGYDLGAFASLLMVGQISPEGFPVIQDMRIKAVLAMSPPVQANSEPVSKVYARIETPCLFITGTKDDGIVGTTKANERRIPFDFINCNDQYLVIFDGTDHMLYSGHLISVLPRIKNDTPYQHSIARLSTNFWNAYLKADPNALSFMMSQNVTNLLNGLGRIERKFYLREHLDANSSDLLLSEKQGKTELAKESEIPQYLSVPSPSYTENRALPRPIRNSGTSLPRRLPIRLP